MAKTVLIQVFMLSGMIVLGYILGKRGYFSKRDSDLMTKVLLDILFPCSVLASGSGDYGDANMSKTFLIIFIYFCILLLFTALAWIIAKILKMSEDDMLVFSRSIGYPNNGFMGVPLGNAVLGAQGTMWVSLTIPGTTIYMFAFLMRRFQREKGKGIKEQIKSLANPLNLSAIAMIFMIATGLKLPVALKQICTSFGNCVTPIAMLVIGYLLSGSPLADAFRKPKVYLITFLRNIFCPLLGAGILSFFNFERNMCLCIVMVMGCSVASSVSIFGSKYQRSPEFASQSLLQSSVLLPITMPLMMLAAERIL